MKVTAKHKTAALDILKTLAVQPSLVQEQLAHGLSYSVQLAGLIHDGFVTSISEEAESYLDAEQFKTEADATFAVCFTPDGQPTGKTRYGAPYVFIPMSVSWALREEGVVV